MLYYSATLSTLVCYWHFILFLPFSPGFPMLRRLLFIFVMTMVIGVSEETLVQQRINYGVIFQKSSDLFLAQDTWYHTFEIAIPEAFDIPRLPSCEMNNHTCLAISHILAQLNSLRTKTATQLNETMNVIMELVPETKVHKSRSKRSLLPFIGTLSKGLFGTATMDDVNILARHMNQLSKVSIQLSKALSQHEDHMSSYISAANERMDNLMSGVKQNMLAIRYIHRQLFTTETTLEHVIDYIIGILIDQIKTTTNLNYQLEEFKLGVLDLVNQRLSPLLIPEAVLQSALADIHRIIDSQFNGFHLTINSVRDVYSSKSFLYARNGTNLYVTLKLPISYFKEPLHLFKVSTLPVPINSTSPHGTQLLDLAPYFAITADQQHYATLTSEDLTDCYGSKTKYCSKNIALSPVTSPSCILALFANDKTQVKENCDFRFLHNVIRPRILEISPNSLLLYRTPLLSMECLKQHKMVTGCDFCIFTLPCRCSVSTNTLYFVPRLGACHKHVDNVTVVHPVNLALLQHFFDNDFVDRIFADTYFDHTVNVTVPDIKLYNHKMSDIIAADSKAHLSLSKLADITKNDAVVYQSLTEPLLEGDIALTTTWPTTDGIITYCSSAGVIVLTVLFIGTILKVRKLAIIVATLQNTKHCDSLVTGVPSFIYTKKPQVNSQDYSMTFDLDISLDHANFALLCTITCFILIVVYRYFRFKTTSKLCLEITCGRQCVLVDLVQLPMCPAHFKIHLPGDVNNLSVTGCLRPKLHVSWPNFCVKSTLSNKTVDVPSQISVSLFTAFKLRSILHRPYHVYIYKVHKGLMTPLRKTELDI